jgi:class 3 adenylate cyclase
MTAETPSAPNEKSIQYEERLVCFIDLLGFKSAIDESESSPQVLNALHEALSELEGGRLVNLLHQSVPAMTETGELTTCEKAGTTHIAQEHWRMVVTQFSDSFVLSCSAENTGSCLMLLQAIDKLQNIFFRHLGMLMRGGVSLGPLIHVQGGPLFGPAMNEAYRIESKCAIYPRVLVDAKAAEHLRQAWRSGPSPIFDTFDGHKALDLISCLWLQHSQDPQDLREFSEQLNGVEQDIKAKFPDALPKVKYLQDRFQLLLQPSS